VVQFFRNIGITSSDIGIKVNSRKVMASVLSAMGVGDDKFAPVCVVMDKFDKIGADAVVAELTETQALSKETATKIVACLLCKSVDDLAALCGDEVDSSGVDELKRLFELADDYGFGDWLVFDASVVRGLAYYTGVVFEGFDRAGELRAICGGGRYDKLLSLYGAVSEVPACGFGFGDCVVVELLKDKGILPELPKTVDFVVAAFNDQMQGAAMRATSLMRSGGANVDLLLEPKKKVANTFDYANRVGARFIAFVAPSEWERGEVRIKDLRLGEDVPDEEKQIDVKVADLADVRGVLQRWADAKAMKNLKL
jgi:histidyl-tRNA synthetase